MSKKVLVVEDQADSREMLKTLLMFEGFSVVTAADGHDGIEKALAQPPDVILTDLHMPGLHGLDMMKLLRQTPQFYKTPIIVLTADTDANEVAFKAGADQVLIKPISFDDLFDSIKRLLEISSCMIPFIGLP
jgi:CheY-like chemotaxis protein